MSCEEAAKIAGCSVLTIQRAIRAGELTAYRPGKSNQIASEDLVAWVKSKKVSTKTEARGEEACQSACQNA
jgi:excisionase family DNA binding protein